MSWSALRSWPKHAATAQLSARPTCRQANNPHTDSAQELNPRSGRRYYLYCNIPPPGIVTVTQASRSRSTVRDPLAEPAPTEDERDHAGVTVLIMITSLATPR